jgi:hypothetical protein
MFTAIRRASSRVSLCKAVLRRSRLRNRHRRAPALWRRGCRSSRLPRQLSRRAGSGGQAAFLLQSFNDPNIAHSTIAKGLQSFLISRTAVGSRRLFQARILGNYRTLLQPVFVSKRGVPACEKASTKRRGRGYCELRIGCKFLGFRHNAIPPFISRAWDHTSVCRLDR